jgi:hypothetical protein
MSGRDHHGGDRDGGKSGSGGKSMGAFASGINFNLLFAPAGSSGTASANILNALFNSPPPTAGGFASTGNPLLDLKLAQKDQTADVALEAKEPLVTQAITAFTKAVKGATSIQQALLNPNVQRVLLTASGLSSYIGETALVQKAFLSNLSDPKSVANQLGDSTLLATVQTYNFAKNGLKELQSPKIMATLTNGYAKVMWRQSLDNSTPGLSNALNFLSGASSIKSVSDILGSPSNFYVITGALGIPPDIVFQSETAQTKAINSRVNYAKFQDPTYVTSLTDQYLISQQANSLSSANSVAGLLV